MAIEFARRKQNIAVVMLHPGTVDTDLSQPFQKVSAQDCAALLCDDDIDDGDDDDALQLQRALNDVNQ